MEKVSDTLLDARKKLGLTLSDVSKATRIGLTTINAWERGASFPRSKNRRVIAKFYKLSEDQLIPAGQLEDEIVAAQRDFLKQHESRVIMLHKDAWTEAEQLIKTTGARDINTLFDRLISEAKAHAQRK